MLCEIQRRKLSYIVHMNLRRLATIRNKIMRMLVCGGRHYKDYTNLARQLWLIADTRSIDCVIEGGYSGADKLAKQWAKNNRINVEEYRPDWDKYGLAAGPIRNTQMLDEGRPDFVVAFPGGAGTADMVSKAEKAGLEVIKILT
jgi:phosphoribosylformylglycinamidine (FGAM) synthase-like amidotransferase family enzyme